MSRGELIELVGGEERLRSLFVDKRIEVISIGKKGQGRRGRPRRTSLKPHEEEAARAAHRLRNEGYTWPELKGYGHRLTLIEYWKMLGLE